MDAKLKDRIQHMIDNEPVFLFMKGNPTFPQCGFSNQVTQILKSYAIPFGHFDVLSDSEVRQGIKDFSDWPTIPQLYIKGEFIGGCDIVREAWENGELTKMLAAAFPDRELTAPKPPKKPANITVEQAKSMLDQAGETLFLDVRSGEERNIAKVEGFRMLDQAEAHRIVNEVDKEVPLVFMCHHGGRSAQAAQWFASQGFQNTYNVEGGIDHWSEKIDTSLRRY